MSEFLFLYRSPAPQGSPEQMQKTMQKWTAWMKELREQGHLTSEGHPLERRLREQEMAKNASTPGSGNGEPSSPAKPG